MRWPFRVVERKRHAQALRPFAQRRGLLGRRRVGARQRVAEQLGPGGEPLVEDLLVARAVLVEVALDDQPETSANSSSATTTVA